MERILYFKILLTLICTAVLAMPTQVIAQGIPDISRLDRETRQSIELACINAKVQGPARYASCINQQLASIGQAPGEVPKQRYAPPPPQKKAALRSHARA